MNFNSVFEELSSLYEEEKVEKAEQAEDEFIAQLNIRSPASIPFVSNIPSRKIEALSFFIALSSVYRLFSCKLIARRLVYVICADRIKFLFPLCNCRLGQ